jgi:hypothetical protein
MNEEYGLAATLFSPLDERVVDHRLQNTPEGSASAGLATDGPPSPAATRTIAKGLSNKHFVTIAPAASCTRTFACREKVTKLADLF